MTDDRVPLFVRLPRAQADALDQLVDTTGRRKQQLVSDMLGDRLEVGFADVRETPQVAVDPGEDVLTLAELAALLRVEEAAVLTRAEAGDLPGRRLGSHWRFSRIAVLAWLAAGDDG